MVDVALQRPTALHRLLLDSVLVFSLLPRSPELDSSLRRGMTRSAVDLFVHLFYRFYYFPLQTPLESSSVDVAVFCLSLMGTDYGSFLEEAHRVLSPGGSLLIAEVKSRFDPHNGGADPRAFVGALKRLGFQMVRQDDSNKMFMWWEFQKGGERKGGGVAWPALKACIYKRR